MQSAGKGAKEQRILSLRSRTDRGSLWDIPRDSVIVELKATKDDNPVFAKQLFTYLRITDKRLGLLMNFNKERLIDGVKRVVNKFPD